MGTLLDATAFIELERQLRRRPAEAARADVFRRLAASLGELEDVGMATITASELLHGVHRADVLHQVRRGAFVEMLLEAFPPIGFDLRCARTHARLWADLAMKGIDIGPHDRIVAATALALGWRVATGNVRHFDRIVGLEVLALRFN